MWVRTHVCISLLEGFGTIEATQYWRDHGKIASFDRVRIHMPQIFNRVNRVIVNFIGHGEMDRSKITLSQYGRIDIGGY